MIPIASNQTSMIADGSTYGGGNHLPELGSYVPALSLYSRSGNGITRQRIRVLLIDTDSATTSRIRTHLRAHTDFELLVEASSGNIDARLTKHQPDVIVIDVDLMESSGYDFARLMSNAMRPVLIFITTNTNYALRAFDLGAVDYLLKPLRDDRFEISLNRIREKLSHRRRPRSVIQDGTASQPLSDHHSAYPRDIIVTDRRGTHVIEPYDIEWIGAAGDYTELHVRDATHLLREPLSVLLGRLPVDAFCRIHRSSVVNLGKVSGLKTLRNQDLLVRLKDKTVLRASRTFSDELRRAITQHHGLRPAVALDH